MKLGRRIRKLFGKYARWLIAVAGILLLSGLFMLASRNLLAFWLLGQNKLQLLGENYAAAFKLVYSPVQYWQKFVRIWSENAPMRQIHEKTVLKVFDESRYFKYVSFVNPDTLDTKPQPGQIIWDQIELVGGEPFLILLYCFEAETGLQYVRMELPFALVSPSSPEVRGFAVIESEGQQPLVTALSPADWKNYPDLLSSLQDRLSAAPRIIDGGKRVFFDGLYYRTSDVSFSIDNNAFHIIMFFEERSISASADMLFFALMVLFPFCGFLIIFLVALPRIQGRRFAGDSRVLQLIRRGESEVLEFKSSLRWDYTTGALNKELENVILKSIAAFTNARGGRLIIGVDDSGKILGLENDFSTLKESGSDYFELHLRNIIDTVFGRDFSARLVRCLFYKFTEGDNAEKQIVVITVGESDEPVYITLDQKGAKVERFFVRSGNSSRALESLSEVNRYIQNRF